MTTYALNADIRRGAAITERDATLDTVPGGVGDFIANAEAYIFLKLKPIRAIEADLVP